MFAVKPEQPFADESAPTDSMIFTHYCGSEFIRESFISDAANVLDVLAPSRMNPLPPFAPHYSLPPTMADQQASLIPSTALPSFSCNGASKQRTCSASSLRS
jgi:hypothetical protein